MEKVRVFGERTAYRSFYFMNFFESSVQKIACNGYRDDQSGMNFSTLPLMQ